MDLAWLDELAPLQVPDDAPQKKRRRAASASSKCPKSPRASTSTKPARFRRRERQSAPSPDTDPSTSARTAAGHPPTTSRTQPTPQGHRDQQDRQRQEEQGTRRHADRIAAKLARLQVRARAPIPIPDRHFLAGPNGISVVQGHLPHLVPLVPAVVADVAAELDAASLPETVAEMNADNEGGARAPRACAKMEPGWNATKIAHISPAELEDQDGDSELKTERAPQAGAKPGRKRTRRTSSRRAQSPCADHVAQQ